MQSMVFDDGTLGRELLDVGEALVTEEEILYDSDERSEGNEISTAPHYPTPVGGKRQRKKTVGGNAARGRVLKIVEEEVKGLNGFVWKSKRPKEDNAADEAEPNFSPRPSDTAALASTPLEYLKLFIDDDMIDKIIRHTNDEIDTLNAQQKRSRTHDSNTAPFAFDEFSALLSLFILSGALQNNHLRTDTLFDPIHSGDQYRATMNSNRFSFLVSALKFESNEVVSEDPTAKLSPIARLWKAFLDNCQAHYVPGAEMTIGRHLVPYRGPCPFTITIHSPAVKHGIQMFLMVDNATKYLINALPYLGRPAFPADATLSSFVVDELVKPIRGSGRTVTLDERFASVGLAESLLAEYKLKTIAQLKTVRRELPPFFVDPKFNGRQNGTSLFLYANDVTAVSYKPCNNTGLEVVITTCSDGDTLRDKTKPAIIHKYEATRGAVDALISHCERMNTVRKTTKWPTTFFFNMLNYALQNAYAIYCLNHPYEKRMQKMDFVLAISTELSKSWMKVRLTFSLPFSLRAIIRRCLMMEDEGSEGTAALDADGEDDSFDGITERRINCRSCTTARRKTRYLCCYCRKPICNEHARRLCHDCCTPQTAMIANCGSVKRRKARRSNTDDVTPRKKNRKTANPTLFELSDDE